MLKMIAFGAGIAVIALVVYLGVMKLLRYLYSGSQVPDFKTPEKHDEKDKDNEGSRDARSRTRLRESLDRCDSDCDHTDSVSNDRP